MNFSQLGSFINRLDLLPGHLRPRWAIRSRLPSGSSSERNASDGALAGLNHNGAAAVVVQTNFLIDQRPRPGEDVPARDVLARVASRPRSRSSCLIAMRSHHRIPRPDRTRPRPPATVDPDLSGSVKTRAGCVTAPALRSTATAGRLVAWNWRRPVFESSGMIMGCRRTVRLEQAGSP